MRLRYWTALAAIGCVTAAVALREAPAPTAPDETNLQGDDAPASADAVHVDRASASQAATPETERELAPAQNHSVTWSRNVGPGDSLDGLLAQAGLNVATRAEVSRAIGSEYDLRRLQPGHRLALEFDAEGAPKVATLEIDDGVRVQAVFGPAPSVRLVPPALDTVRLAAEAAIGSSIYAALDAAGIPTRFATDLELAFDGTLDLRRAMVGGEHLRLSWREQRLGERVIGEPVIDYAELVLGTERYEVVWPDDDSQRTRIFRDSELLRIFHQPIMGARLSSSFGMRQHPIHGSVRMHSGVDFAAAQGAPVLAIQSGRIASMGSRPGYGLMVEIEHARGIRTIYAHLSAISEIIDIGQRVEAGDEIGRVGSTGTSTAPHLHYEIVVDGTPVQPLTNTELLDLERERSQDVTQHLDAARGDLARLLVARPMGTTRD